VNVIKNILMSEHLFELLKDFVEMPKMVKGMTITLEMSNPVQIDCSYYPIKYDLDEKDRLIAAAPDLLDALQTWLDIYECPDYENCEEVIKARSAIAKATGGAA